MSTRGARHLADLRREAVREQQERDIASAHRTLDRLEAEQDRLTAMGWARTEPQNRRLGTLTTLITDQRQRITDLERLQETERVFRLEPQPLPAAVTPNGSRRGLPPSWYLEPPARPAARQPARTRAAAPARRPVPPPKRPARTR
jgi:hypothetical protein